MWNALGLQLFVGFLACYMHAGIQTPVLMFEPQVLLIIEPSLQSRLRVLFIKSTHFKKKIELAICAV